MSRSERDLDLTHLALLNQTSLYAFVFKNDLKKCEFYDLDLENIQYEKTKRKRERFTEGILQDDLPIQFKKYEASIKYLDKAI